MTTTKESTDGQAHAPSAAKTETLERLFSGEAKRRKRLTHERVLEESEGASLGSTIFLLSLILAFGIGVGAYALVGAVIPVALFSPDKTTENSLTGAVVNAPAKEETGVIVLGNASREEILAELRTVFNGTTNAGGGIRAVRFTAADGRGVENDATTGTLLNALNARAPQKDFLRSLDTAPPFGILKTGNLSGFLRLRTRSYPETFAGMLLWETEMAGDLLPSLRPDIKRSDIGLLNGRPFVDERVLGLNARVLNNPDGTPALAYAFLDEEILVIAGGREALWVLLAKFRAETE